VEGKTGGDEIDAAKAGGEKSGGRRAGEAAG